MFPNITDTDYHKVKFPEGGNILSKICPQPLQQALLIYEVLLQLLVKMAGNITNH